MSRSKFINVQRSASVRVRRVALMNTGHKMRLSSRGGYLTVIFSVLLESISTGIPDFRIVIQQQKRRGIQVFVKNFRHSEIKYEVKNSLNDANRKFSLAK